VVGVAATVGCGDASVGEMPSPILTAPPRATMTPLAVGEAGGNAGDVATVRPVLAEMGEPEHYQAPATLPPVPTAMVAAQERSSVVEQRTPNAPVGGSSPPVPATSGVEQWRPLVESIFPAFAVETALRIMRCESSGNPNATGAAGEMGLFQIHPRWHPDATYDPHGNMLAAFRISAGGTNWNPWTCR
jgi:soluble lytic murein transglycosylase-like protein